MPKTRPSYPAEYRNQLVELVRSGRTSEALAREFEPCVETIRHWYAQDERDVGRRHDGLSTAEQEEVRRLRRENRHLRQERDILKKAAAWFAKESGTLPKEDTHS